MQLLKTFFLFATLFSLFTMNANSQGPIKKYETAWKKVEDHVKKNLPKSALAEVKKIYQLAKKEKQDAQIIKSLVYITGLQTENREDNQIFSITEIEKEISWTIFYFTCQVRKQIITIDMIFIGAANSFISFL